VVKQARQTREAVCITANDAAQRVAGRLGELLPWVEQVIGQTTRRVLQGEQVPASAKVVSLFEPHGAILRKGKPGKPVEFGRLVWLDEAEGGIITRYQILMGNPNEAAQVVPSVDAHISALAKRQLSSPATAACSRRPTNATWPSARSNSSCCPIQGEIGQTPRPRAPSLVCRRPQLAGRH